MKVGVFQFRGSDNISDNHEAIKRAIISASQNNVRLAPFKECYKLYALIQVLINKGIVKKRRN